MPIKFLNETLNKAVRDLITVANPEVLAIRAEQNAPIPAQRPFASVRVAMLAPEGWAEKSYTNLDPIDIEELTSERIRVRATVNYYGSSATVSSMDEAITFRTFLQGTTALETLAAAGMGYVRTSEARNLTALENDNFEERAQIDIDLYTLSERVETLLEIQKIQVDGEVEEATETSIVSTLIDENLS